MLASLSGEACKVACQRWYFSPHSHPPDAEDRRRFRAEWLAALLLYIRPRQFDPGPFSPGQWESLGKIAEGFLCAGDGRQRTVIRRLFDLTIPWREIATIGGATPEFIPQTDAAVLQTRHLHGFEMAEEWDRRSVPVKDAESWRALYRARPGVFYNRVSDLRQKYGVKVVRRLSSSR